MPSVTTFDTTRGFRPGGRSWTGARGASLGVGAAGPSMAAGSIPPPSTARDSSPIITVDAAPVSPCAANVSGPHPPQQSSSICQHHCGRGRREAVGPDIRLRAQLGRDLVRALSAAGRQADAQRFAQAAPLTADAPDGAGLVAVLAGRVPDGAAVRGGWTPNWRRQTPLSGRYCGPGGMSTTRECLRRRGPSVPRRPDRQERAFSVQAAGAPTLTAEDARGAAMDWWAFDADPRSSLGAPPAGTATTVTSVPRLARYAGMPVTRFWQYEDASASFGLVSVDPQDLGRMLLIDFALAGADDWHVVPLPLAVGTVATIAQLRVVDTFGCATDLDPVDDGIGDASDGPVTAGGGPSGWPEQADLPDLRDRPARLAGGQAPSQRWRMFLTSSGDDAVPLVMITPTPAPNRSEIRSRTSG